MAEENISGQDVLNVDDNAHQMVPDTSIDVVSVEQSANASQMESMPPDEYREISIMNDIEISEQEQEEQPDEAKDEMEEEEEYKNDEPPPYETTTQNGMQQTTELPVQHSEEEEEDADADSNTPLQQKSDDNGEDNDGDELMEMENNIHNKMYMHNRQHSVSTSDIPHSVQVLTPQHEKRPRDDVLAKIHDMGFSRDIADRAYSRLLMENNGDHDAFTTEQVIEYMLQMDEEPEPEDMRIHHDDDDHNNDDIVLHINERDEAAQEPLEEEIVANKETDGLPPGDYIECAICRMDRERKDMYNASCGHDYCKICLQRHYTTSIENGVVQFKCMEDSCDRMIDETELFLFINDEIYKAKYHKFSRNVKLAKDPSIRWCVKAGCDTPIRRKARKQTKLECPSCGTFVCYNCAGLYYNNNSDDSNNVSTNYRGKQKKQRNEHNCNKQLDDKLVTW
eukprot:CAMPEP_0197046506 /NCGR_PEP_ID=MMETSP1384-20130603/22224_1 /TAXON_ID=29189 /ORGANISM="Ammonia sp." /LENGTH=450 /DNA_ID=CAMNT_0042478321 /DNA_START=24 /DNA_END=1373 /DNA_ORIENTATION=-